MLPVAILAGGKGTRIASLAGTLPKALVPVNGHPFLDYQLRWLAGSGACDVVLCVGYGADAIGAFVGNGSAWGLRVAYSADGERPLGTGGALLRALPLLGDAFLSVYGDALLQCSPARVAAALTPDDDGVMTVFENRNRWLPSNVAVDNGRVIAYDKEAHRPNLTYIDYGLSAFAACAFDGYSSDVAFDLSVVHRAAIRRGRLRAFPCDERWYEVGSPEGHAETERFVASHPYPTKAERDVR